MRMRRSVFSTFVHESFDNVNIYYVGFVRVDRTWNQMDRDEVEMAIHHELWKDQYQQRRSSEKQNKSPSGITIQSNLYFSQLMIIFNLSG